MVKMSRSQAIFQTLLEHLYQVSMKGALFSLIIVLLLILLQIVDRYFPQVIVFSTGWLDEILQLFVVWMVFLGAVAVACTGSHISVNLLEFGQLKLLQPFVRKIVDLSLAVFGLILLVAGIQLAHATMSQSSPILFWPKGLWYLPVATGGLGLLCVSICRRVLNKSLVDKDLE
jgi:TRAP-type C4-dicarboxylate transport system permease small subunit